VQYLLSTKPEAGLALFEELKRRRALDERPLGGDR
jgi:hypothetical protein